MTPPRSPHRQPRGTVLGGARGRPDVSGLPVPEDVRREIQAHIDHEVEALERAGWEPAAAHAEAVRRFGDLRSIRSECERITHRRDRSVGRARTWSALRQDIRYALRRLRRSPGFTVVAVLTLALGIGANTAMFSLIDGVLLSALPYPGSNDLVSVAEEHEGGRPGPIPWPNFEDWREQNRSLEALAAHSSGVTTVLGADRPVRVTAATVSVDFFRVFRAVPELGRLTLDSDHGLGAAPVAVVSRRFWRNDLGGGTDALGRVIQLYGRSYEVVGVLPAGFDFPSSTDVWTPMELFEQSLSRTAHNNRAVARLAAGTSAAQADQELDQITRVIGASFTEDEFDAVGGIVTPLRDQLTGSSRTPLLLLLGASALVLLIACVNLASTQLARGSARRTELAVRSALGAQRSRLVGQLLTENALITLVGGVVGVALGWSLIRAVARLGAGSIPRIAEVQLDGRVLGFALAIAVLTALLFGLLPAVRLVGGHLVQGLRAGGRGGDGVTSARTWRLLVGSEVALALVLLVGTGLLVRSFVELTAQDSGVEPAGVVAADLSVDRAKYDTLPEFAAFYADLVRRTEALPAVTAAGIANAKPIGGNLANGYIQVDGDLSRDVNGYYVAADQGFFETLGIPLTQGRLFDERDHYDAPHVALVSQSFADRVWPGENPIGRTLTSGGMDNFWNNTTWATVVGVVGDVRYEELGDAPGPTYYFPISQRPFRAVRAAVLFARARDGQVGPASNAVRELIQRVDPDIPPRIQPLTHAFGDSVANRRFTTMILASFGGVSLLLALIGIYGVVSYRVARRTREMGVRIALGAEPGNVRGLVMRDALGMVAGGLIVGLIVSLAGSSAIRGILFGVAPTDPWAFVAAAAVLVAGAASATWLPARRATRVDPVASMQAE